MKNTKQQALIKTAKQYCKQNGNKKFYVADYYINKQNDYIYLYFKRGSQIIDLIWDHPKAVYTNIVYDKVLDEMNYEFHAVTPYYKQFGKSRKKIAGYVTTNSTDRNEIDIKIKEKLIDKNNGIEVKNSFIITQNWYRTTVHLVCPLTVVTYDDILSLVEYVKQLMTNSKNFKIDTYDVNDYLK